MEVRGGAGGAAAGPSFFARPVASPDGDQSVLARRALHLANHLANRTTQPIIVATTMKLGSPHVSHAGAFSQLHTATTITSHMTRPTMSRTVFFTAPPPRNDPLPTRPLRPDDRQIMRIAFLGDSLTEGWPGAAYLPLLDGRSPQHQLINRGHAGDTVADLLARMRHEGMDVADLAFVWVGANDAVIGAWDAADAGSGWSWPQRLARLRGDYEELVEWVEGRTPRLILVRPLILESQGSLWEERATEIGLAVAEIAAGRDACRDLDLRPSFAAGDGPFTIDGVHFTDAGAEAVADAIAAAIAETERERP